MNKRITVSLPDYVYQQLVTWACPGQVSSFVSRAVSDKLAEETVPKGDPWDEFLNAHKLITKKNKISIKAAISKGRA